VRAVVAHGPHDFRLEPVPDPEPDGGAVIRVEAAGVCAADRMIYGGDSPWELSYPFVPGHEFVGTIVAVAPEAGRRWQVAEGDRVTAEVIAPCDECALCRSGRYHLCRRGVHLGSGLPGGWADFMRLPPRARVWRIPPGLAPERAVLTEPLSCGVYAARRAAIAPGETVAVAGIGPIGSGTLLTAARAEPSFLLALVTSPERAALARQLGADAALDVRSADAAAAVAEATGERGLDVYVDTSGSTESLELGLELLRPGVSVLVYVVYRLRV
jgi:L-iditol 2-dehydrogenase